MRILSLALLLALAACYPTPRTRALCSKPCAERLGPWHLDDDGRCHCADDTFAEPSR